MSLIIYLAYYYYFIRTQSALKKCLFYYILHNTEGVYAAVVYTVGLVVRRCQCCPITFRKEYFTVVRISLHFAHYFDLSLTRRRSQTALVMRSLVTGLL